MSETKRARLRRIKDGFFEKYIDDKKVIDIGCGRLESTDGEDLIAPHAMGWDKDNGDATTMTGVEDNSFDTIYLSHLVEHLVDPVTGIKNWYRICKPGGHIIISVPHRDLYERRKTLPSRWNGDHKWFYLPDRCEPPHTFSLEGVVKQALLGLPYKIIELKVQNTCTNVDRPDEHGNGEYSVEIIIQKL